MNEQEWLAAQKLQRDAARHTEPWHADGQDIENSDGIYVGHMRDPALAKWVAAAHNCFIPLCNFVRTLKHKLADRKAMTREVMNDEIES